MTTPPEGRLGEERRHACEVSYVLALPDHAARARYLALVAAARGEERAQRLRRDIWALLRPCP